MSEENEQNTKLDVNVSLMVLQILMSFAIVIKTLINMYQSN